MIELAGMAVYIGLVEQEISPASRSRVFAQCHIPLTACRKRASSVCAELPYVKDSSLGDDSSSH